MPTNKPRVNVVLEPEVYAVLNEFCSLSKRSMSSFLAESANDAVPMLNQLLPLLRVASQMSEHSKSVAQRVLDKIVSDTELGLSQLLTQFPDLATPDASAVSLPAAAQAEGVAVAETELTPLLLTRGSVNQSMHQNGEKPRLWLASSSEKEGE
jgi:hypothetical protein